MTMSLVRVYLAISFFIHMQLSVCIEKTVGIERDSVKGIASGYFQSHSNYYLQVPVLRSVFVQDAAACSRECVLQQNCFSVNVAVNLDEHKKLRFCELLATTSYYEQENFRPHPFFHHFSTLQFSPAMSCVDHLRNGAFKSGLYTILDNPQGDRENRLVYCDLTSEPGRAWTLVMSWRLANRNLQQFKNDHFSTNAPFDDMNPNWDGYRLPLTVMISLKTQSPLWRVTCSFPFIKSNATLYSDYLRCNFHDFDLFSFTGYGVCKKVDYVSIRGHVGVSTEAQFWQQQGQWGLHIDSCATGCAFKPNVGCTSSEDDFGYYHSTNLKFRCTASNDHTTNWWFGGEK